jgi:hypothetical protein
MSVADETREERARRVRGEAGTALPGESPTSRLIGHAEAKWHAATVRNVLALA